MKIIWWQNPHYLLDKKRKKYICWMVKIEILGPLANRLFYKSLTEWNMLYSFHSFPPTNRTEIACKISWSYVGFLVSFQSNIRTAYYCWPCYGPTFLQVIDWMKYVFSFQSFPPANRTEIVHKTPWPYVGFLASIHNKKSLTE